MTNDGCINISFIWESGKYVEQGNTIGKWTTNGGFMKDPQYTYMEIPRYFKVGTVSDDKKSSNKSRVVAKAAVGAAIFLIFYFFIYFTIKHVTIATNLF